jgi:ketosteroid isomerase-like protein
MDQDTMRSDLDVVKEVYGRVAVGDLDGLRAILHPDVALVEAPSLAYGGRYEGKEGFVELVVALGAHWDDFSCTDFEYFAGEGAVVVAFRLQATSRATGEKVDQRLAELWRVRDGLISFLEPFYFDTHAVRVAQGLA